MHLLLRLTAFVALCLAVPAEAARQPIVAGVELGVAHEIAGNGEVRLR